MKKLLLLILFSYLFPHTLLADQLEKKKQLFAKWLYLNGYDQYLDKTGDPVDMMLDRSICTSMSTWDDCTDADGKLIPTKDRKYTLIYPTNLKLKLNKKKANLGYKSNPNRDTLIYYLWHYSYRPKFMGDDPNKVKFHEIKHSNEPYEFKFNLIEDKFVKKQMKTKGILSYLYFQDGKVLIDEISPKERLGEFIKEDTKFISMSMNKSVTSYILGHAICEGYIDSIDSTINDWPIIQNSLYYNQKLINFLNMNTGDQKYINEFTHPHGTPIANSSYSFEDENIQRTIKQYFQDSVPSKKIYNYNGFLPQLILNYVHYKTGDDFKKLLNTIFKDKIKIKHSITINKSHHNSKLKSGGLHPMIKATRYDYLRLAKAIMDDYQNDTCVGKYLKEIHKRRIPKKYNENKHEPAFNRTKSYGGYFHMDYPGLKNKVVFGMGGYGGRAILIDMENSRIVVLNSLHYNNTKYKYNVKKLLIDPIKKGK